MADNKHNSKNLISDIIALIEKSKQYVVSTVNSSLTILFWQIGYKILTFELKSERAEYGKQIVATLSRQLSWSHFLTMIPIKDKAAREFYGQLAFEHLYSVRELLNIADITFGYFFIHCRQICNHNNSF